ncbi:MAG TPA: ATP-binding protein [Smithella sp.]|nr:ATP-binding protein [Smithella sp.]HRS97368.1 ATP-binding protein [Smithella sp.]
MNDVFIERRQEDRRSTDRRQGERRKFERRSDVRKQNQEAIREHMEKYRVLLKDIKDAYFEVDVLGNFTVVNTAMCDALGYGPAELIGEKYWTLMDKEVAKLLKEAVEDLHQKDQPVHLLDMVARKKDGARIVYEAMVSVIRDVDGVVIGFRGVGRDVTRRREMEAELKRNQEELLKKNREIDESREKLEAALAELKKTYEELKASQMKILQQEKMASIGQLAAGVAHEINNPMSFVASNLSTLEKYIKRLDDFIRTLSAAVESVKDPGVMQTVMEKRGQLKVDHVLEDAKLLIKESLDGADRVKKIVQELKSFSRMDDEDYKIADINECIDSAITIVWNELKYKTTLKKEYGDLPKTKCYPRQINQVFVNLLINAVNSIADKGVITIRTWHEDGFIWMQVSDTGVGIPRQNLSRIFEPFFTTKEASKGTGLGLSITYDIVQRHKGEITVQSEVGAGSTFTVKIPVVA